MGPGPDGPGKQGLQEFRLHQTKSFNGAGAGWPRKTPVTLPEIVSALAASMGPGPDGPGKLAGDVVSFTGDSKLQWGRGRMAPENPERAQKAIVRDRLQWGRGRMAPENHLQI